jgi:hypothetical protein
MKKIICFATLFLLTAFGTLFAQDNAPDPKDTGDIGRDAAVKAFEELLANAKKNPLDLTKFNAVAPVSVPITATTTTVESAPLSCVNAVKVWFELSDGRYVNPKYYRWAPGEVFYVHVLSATPVFVALYQNYPGISESKRAYPVDRFPASYNAIQPGIPTRLPVAFQMDLNHNSEYMSIVVTKADSPVIRTEVTQSTTVAAQTTTTQTAQTTTTASIAGGSGILKGGVKNEVKESALTKFDAINNAGLADQEFTEGVTKCRRVRYYVSYPYWVRPVYYCRYLNHRYHYIPVVATTNVIFVNYRATYTTVDDASLYLFSDNGIGQLQLTLQKCGPRWSW